MTIMPRRMPRPLQVSVAAAKRDLSRLLGRVAFGGERVLILRRGQPMALLVPAGEGEAGSHLGDVQGWLDDDDPFFATIDEVVERRARHRPRTLAKRRGGSGART